MHHNLVEQGAWLASIVRGYFAYHAIPGNWEAIGAFRTQVARMWYRTLRRRSQRTCITWDRMTKIVNAWLPRARILHPWPEQRCAAIIQGKSRMRSFRSYGSVRGAARKGGPYRDRFTERILTVVQTLRLQHRPVLDHLRQAITAHRAATPLPALCPTGV
ncbi:MAG: hypothetical protein V2A79_07955 [Planctomycetota bacterium]